jgi:phage shock protein E
MNSFPAITLSATLLAGLTFCLVTQTGTATPPEKPTASPATSPAPQERIFNPAIDYPTFLEDAKTVGAIREKRRLTEAEFQTLSRAQGTLVLDARSADKYAMLHVDGAVNLPLTDFTARDLARVIPNKETRILIYCNNNFEREDRALTRKAEPASLNIYTFNSLYAYGYTNVYELGPLLDIRKTKLRFAGTLSKDGTVPAEVYPLMASPQVTPNAHYTPGGNSIQVPVQKKQ